MNHREKRTTFSWCKWGFFKQWLDEGEL